MNFQIFKLDLENADESEIKLPTFIGSSKNKSSRKTPTSALLTTLKSLTVWITTSTGKFFKQWEYQTIWPAPEKSVCRSRKQQLEANMEQQMGSKSVKEYVKSVYCHPACLTYMQSTSCEMPGWMKHKLESRLPGEISITSICRWYHLYGRKWRRTKEFLDENERGEWQSWLKTQHSENKDHGIQSITSWQIDGETLETVRDLIFWGAPKSLH